MIESHGNRVPGRGVASSPVIVRAFGSTERGGRNLTVPSYDDRSTRPICRL